MEKYIPYHINPLDNKAQVQVGGNFVSFVILFVFHAFKARQLKEFKTKLYPLLHVLVCRPVSTQGPRESAFASNPQ